MYSVEWLKFKRLAILSVDKDVEQLEWSYTVSQNIKWQNHFENQSSSFSCRQTYNYTIGKHLYFLVLPKRNEDVCQQKYSYNNVHSIIHTHIFINRKVDKQTLIYIYSNIVLNNRDIKYWYTDII